MTPSVLFVHYTPPGVVGGVEHILRQQVALLRARGFDVRVVAGREAPNETQLTVIPEIDAARPENARLEAELLAGVAGPRFTAARAHVRDQLVPLARDADFVLVHNAFTLHFSLPLTAVLWEIAATRPPGTTVSWSHDLSWTNPLYLPGMHAGYPWELLRVRAPGVRYVTISGQRAIELEDLWNGRDREWISVIPNGVDPDSFYRLSGDALRLAREYRLYERDAVLLLPVRITRRKNVELGIRTVAALRQHGLDVVFLVSGPQAPHHPGRSSAYLRELQELSGELGVADSVIFASPALGHNLDEQSVIQLYSLADVLFFPSAQEGFGLPILEAALARLPVVVSDIPIFREVGGAEATYVSLAEDVDRIAETVIETLHSPGVRLRRRVLGAYRWDAIVDDLIIPLFNPQPGDA